jgi:hypothetical protein
MPINGGKTMTSQEDIWDHNRDIWRHEPRLADLTLSQKMAIAKMIGALEGIVTSGILPEKTELECRGFIAEALTAFGLPAAWETEMPKGEIQ